MIIHMFRLVLFLLVASCSSLCRWWNRQGTTRVQHAVMDACRHAGWLEQLRDAKMRLATLGQLTFWGTVETPFLIVLFSVSQDGMRVWNTGEHTNKP